MANVWMLSGTLVVQKQTPPPPPDLPVSCECTLGHAVPIYTRAVARQAAWQPYALPRPSCACQPVVKSLSELYPNAPSASYVPLVPLDLGSHTFLKDYR